MGMNLATRLISDLGCATALVCEGIRPHDLFPDDKGPKVFFVFEDTDKVQEIVDQYWIGSHKVSSREFHENSKMLKSRIYQFKDNNPR